MICLIVLFTRYAFEGNYGNEVIGIGQFLSDGSDNWDLSQGRNPFLISATDPTNYNSANLFYLTGHDKGDTIWTNQNIPNDSTNTRRLQRIWRADKTGDIGQIHYEVKASDLPSFPSGFTKLVLIVDDHDANFPNFANQNTKVLEFDDNGSGDYTIDYDMPDSAFYTLGVVKPTLSFVNNSVVSIEGNPLPDSTLVSTNIKIKLNYTPSNNNFTSVTAGYKFLDGTAFRSSDYGYSNATQQAGETFAFSQYAYIPVYIVNDVIQETPATEYFSVVLDPSTTTAGINIGSRDTLTYYIYDDDPPPKVSFQTSTSSVLENAGYAQVVVYRTGSTSSSATAHIFRNDNSGDTYPATQGLDYNFPYTHSSPLTITFAPNQVTDTVLIPILDDQIDEYDETIELGIEPVTTVGPGSILNQTLTITDDDPEPTATFLTSSAEGYSTVGNPYLYVVLDRQSAKDVTVSYQVLGTGTNPATQGVNYSIANPGSVTFSPMDTLAYPTTLTVMNVGATDSTNRTITLQLQSSGTVNATIGSQDQEVYTIINYSPFEWQGAAGVGNAGDDIVWVDADRISGSDGTAIQSIPNFSTRNISVTQNTAANRATLNVTNGNTINGRKTLSFDGNDWYEIANDGAINLAGYYTKKAYFMVIKTGNDVSTRQVLYEQGGGSRGLSLYIEGGYIYFHAWNNPNDGTASHWGSGAGPARYAKSQPISANTAYIVSAFYDMNDTDKIVIYTNGQKGSFTDQSSDIGRIYAHSGQVGLGGIDNATRFVSNPVQVSSGDNFTGTIAELILFNEAPINDVRRTILENYLSAKYNIPLDTTDTPQIVPLVNIDASSTDYFGNFVAGIGIGGSVNGTDVHLDAQGPAVLRIKNPSVKATNSYLMWGNNGVGLSQTWPYSGSNIPNSIAERSGRVWKVFRHGNTLNGVEIYIRYNQLSNASILTSNDLKLLIQTNSDPQNFSNASVVPVTQIRSGYVAYFSNVNLPNGAYFALGNSNSSVPLPIELMYFNATLQSNAKKVDLNWATATEINNDYFSIERAGKDLNFKEIAYVPGAGISSLNHYYHQLDENPLPGINYYRLKQVDYDGNVTFSDVKSVIVPYSGFSDDIMCIPTLLTEEVPYMLRFRLSSAMEVVK